MRIEIHPETPEEKNQLSEPWVRSGVVRVGLAGRMDPKACDKDFEFGFIRGPWPQVKSELARLVIDGDNMTAQQNAVNAVLQAHNIVAEQAKSQAILAKARNGVHPRIVGG